MSEPVATAVILELTLTHNAEVDVRNDKTRAIVSAIREAFNRACAEQSIDGGTAICLRGMTPKRFEAWGRRRFGRGR